LGGSPISVKFGKALALLSLATAGVGLYLHYTVHEINAPLLANAGLKLTHLWVLTGLLLLGSASELLLCGPRRKGQFHSLLRFLGWTIWLVAAAAAILWLLAVILPSLWSLWSPLSLAIWDRMAAWGLTASLAIGAVTFDFRASPWVQRHRNLLLNSAALLLGLLAALGIAEWAMRHVFRPPVFSPLYAASDIAGCGFEMKPNFDGPCGNVGVRLNSDGFRSPEISPQKTRKRILAIGDSVTFGAWVEQDKSFPAVLQQLLPADRYEVINAGVPAYDLEQVAALFKGKGARYDPDVVIYTFVYDDIADPLVLGGGGALLQEKGKRYGGAIAMPDRFRFFPMPQWLVQRSRLVAAILMRYYRFREGQQIGAADRDLSPDLLAERWDWLENRLFALSGAVEKAGARFLLVIFPVGLSEPSSARLMSIARNNAVEALDLRSVLGDAKNYAAKFMTPWDAHPNAAAHALMAAAIADRLDSLRLIEPASPSVLDTTPPPANSKPSAAVGESETSPPAVQRQP
jgi:hypothetical protein